MSRKSKGANRKKFTFPDKKTMIALAAAAVLFVIIRMLLLPAPSETAEPEEYATFDTGKVEQILMDSTQSDPIADGGSRGEQLLIVRVTSGQYKGQTLQVYNYVGPLYGDPVKTGDSVVMIISTYKNGDHKATVYEYDRLIPLAVILILFIAVTVAVGGRTGVKSLVSLCITLATLFLILIPALLRGAPMLPLTFICSAYIAVVCLILMGGVCTKTVCAGAGAVSGTAIAMLFGLFCQTIMRVSGLREEDAEALLQMRQTGESSVGLKGLLVGGIIISSLGAVLDVTMGISSSLVEVHAANPTLGFRDLFRSGLNIGKDMVGTMTNTLILAFLGSDFTFIIYLYSLGLSFHQVVSSAFVALELIGGAASSVGVMLSIPITAWITARALSAGSDLSSVRN